MTQVVVTMKGINEASRKTADASQVREAVIQIDKVTQHDDVLLKEVAP